jgi:anti-sigma factor RsiW
MAHERYGIAIQEAVDGTLGSIRRADLDMHLRECDECRAVYEDLVRIRDAGAEMAGAPARDRV